VMIATDTFANPAQQYRDSAAYLGGGFPRRVSNLRLLPPGLLLAMLQFPPTTHNTPLLHAFFVGTKSAVQEKFAEFHFHALG